MALRLRSLPVLVALVLLALPLPLAAGDLTGRARAVDGDTLEVAGQKVRLFGIDAPELDQHCDRGGGRWACGRAAREALAEIVGRQRLACAVQDVDRYGRIVALCEAGGEDVAARMVRQGMAVAYRRYSGRYADAEAAARADGIGLWASTYVQPEQYRAERQGTDPQQAGGCRIKGNIARSGSRIYHLPGQADYDATRINERAGERWFCTEAEARAEGFRRAAR
ncbi:thermonuclease family protein [Paragemmobacter ruber]|uniref:Thermonuclease family protein n=1 Tax=Paragemmobacter ruber TaxID=1985673 RepID=A0ABW9Y178_9RHOB|nr:thermonuclease family protein [Rhodobacter ruber]NBE06234.1 thermonuclease family protein [Rhodobacter ruber]